MRPFSAVLRCLPILCNVRCDRSILVCSVFRNLALLSPSFVERAIRMVAPHVTFALQFRCIFTVFSMLTVIGRFKCQFCPAALSSFPVFCIVHGDWFIQMSSVLKCHFGSHPGRGCWSNVVLNPRLLPRRAKVSARKCLRLKKRCPSVLNNPGTSRHVEGGIRLVSEI